MCVLQQLVAFHCVLLAISVSVCRRVPNLAAEKRPPILRHLVFEILSIKECDVPNNAIRFSNVRMGMTGKVDFIMDADVNVSREATALKEVEIKLTKCRDEVTVNTCEYFQTWRYRGNNLCGHWNDATKPWSVALDRVKPRPTCPVREFLQSCGQGQYQIHNGTVDLDILDTLHFPLEGSIWQVRAIFKEGRNAVHACVDLSVEPHRVRD